MESTKGQPKVTLIIELRPFTSEQKEAGKRFFERLVNRAQSDKGSS